MKTRVLCGLDQLQSADATLRGRRIGLMTNPTGIDRGFRSAINIIAQQYDLRVLFACEHGVRGNQQAGDHIDSYFDSETQVPVYSLYGRTHHMTQEMLNAFDVFVFDMQDVGARFYTYLYSLSNAMEDCAVAQKRVVVLDRPNPLGGSVVSGTLLDERFHSFVGEYPIPTRYGLTIGEYTLWVKNHLALKLDLSVIPLSGWKRTFLFPDTDLAWIAPSPNCPTPETAFVYHGTCIFEGTNLSEGRGTTLPFQLIGAPYVNGGELERRMKKHPLSGLHFRSASFIPQFSKWQGQVCHGVQVHVIDTAQADPFAGGLMLMEEIRNLHPDAFAFRPPEDNTGVGSIDRLLGTDAYRLGKKDAQGLIDDHRPLIREFEAEKKQFELY